jgi:spore maturation protein SpmA
MLKLDSLEKRLFSVIAAALFVMIGLYGFLVVKTIFNVAERKGLESEIARLASEVSSLEFSYIAAKGSVTREFAAARGFADIAGALYVRRDTDAALSFNRR